ncbi:Hypothetical protein MexAM1_META1p2612 [Methylorubrum extorquens AM1]|uniref:Uncharacterized protein n=1 Tax=Methylorubrum extorquens (strain ATCC 14718 / DSM 1338 / JCM 2805 / NCIMB 9133 / AM1) TaxID=272630 RepID=C5ASE5_METEA|nr:Hypothetical protein MexAM1_META1p2612 [Methylorubrum extorquens AM1]
MHPDFPTRGYPFMSTRLAAAPGAVALLAAVLAGPALAHEGMTTAPRRRPSPRPSRRAARRCPTPSSSSPSRATAP